MKRWTAYRVLNGTLVVGALALTGWAQSLTAENRSLERLLPAERFAQPTNSLTAVAGWHSADLVVFHLPGCRACASVDDLVDRAQTDHPELAIRRIDVGSADGVTAQDEAARQAGLKPSARRLVPAIRLKSGFYSADPNRIAGVLANWIVPEHRPSGVQPWHPCDANSLSACVDSPTASAKAGSRGSAKRATHE